MKKRAKNLFVPHEGNKYQPDILQRISVGVMFGLILLSFVAANLQALLWMSSDWLVSTILPAVIVELTNEERIDESLGTLTVNAKLTEAANLKAAHMAEHEYFAHYSPAGVSPWHWFDEAAYSFIHAGENLAVHFTDSADVVEGWMNSPTHKANIMNGNYTEIGIGTAKGEYKGYSTVYVVQLFGAPAAPAPLPVTEESTVLAVEANAPEVVTLETTTVAPETEEAAEKTEEVAPATFETVEIEPADEGVEVTEDSGEIVEEDVVVVYSDFATTSREGVPAITTPVDGGSGPSVGTFARTSVEPSLWLQMFYAGMALFVFAALLLSIAIEWRRQHPVQIAYGTGLIAVMGLLYFVHTELTSGVLIV